VILLQTPTVFCVGEGPFLSGLDCHIGLMMLGRQKYIKQSH